MRRAYSYIRFSKRDQANGDSLRRQLALTQAYCDREGLRLDESLHLHDLGVSAFKGKNATVGALSKFLEAVRRGRVPKGSVLIVESLDRLSRNELDDALELFRGLLRAGIDITTLTPPREYTKACLKDAFGLIEALICMTRAHEESATKSERVRAALREKREQLHEKPYSSQCPAWLRLKADGSGFEMIPAAVAAVRRIYKLARAGFGSMQIIHKLNEESVHPFGGKKPDWCRAYITSILRTRTVLGEYQPHVMRDGKRVPEGKPVPNYFPAVISEADWYATRRVVEGRRYQRGPCTKRIRSLFTGIIFDARDGCTMHVRLKGWHRRVPYLVSSGRVNRKQKGQSFYIPYDLIEKWFLRLLHKDLTAELLPDQPEGKAVEIARLTEKLMDLDRRIQKVQKAVEEEPDYESLIATLRGLEKRKKATSAELEKVRQEQAHSDAETFGEALNLHAAMRACPPEQLVDLRTQLKARIRSLVESIWVLINGDRKGKLVTMQIFLRNGNCLHFTGEHPDRDMCMGIYLCQSSALDPNYDLRRWRHVAEKPAFKSTMHKGQVVWSDQAVKELKLHPPPKVVVYETWDVTHLCHWPQPS
jgi:DNA invertase Pin-like site-specific DNA recombinase